MDFIFHFSFCISMKNGKEENEIKVLACYFFLLLVEYKGKATSYTHAKEPFL